MPRLTQPKEGEPIKLVTTKGGEYRYQATVTTSAPGAAKRTQARRNFDTLKEARTFVSDTRATVRAGEFQARSTMTLDQVLDQWVLSLDAKIKTGSLRVVTVDGYKAALKPVRLHLGGRKLTGLTWEDFEEDFIPWAAEHGCTRRKQGGMSNASICNTLRVTSQALGWSVKKKMIRHNPMTDVEMPTPRPEPVVRWKSLADFRTFAQEVDAARSDRRLTPGEAVGLRLALSGMRRSEIVGLTWSCVDFENGRVAVVQGRTKQTDGGRERLTPPKSADSRRWVYPDDVAPGTMLQLKELHIGAGRPATNGVTVADDGRPTLPIDWQPGGFIVLDAAGLPILPFEFTRRFAETVAAAGLPAIHLHSTRHSLESILRNDPSNAPHHVAAMLGHSVKVADKHYVKTDASDLRIVGERLRAQLG